MALHIILGTAFEIEYQVLEGGDLDIDFQMSSPSGTLLFNELRSEEGLHEIASAEEGDYKVGIQSLDTFSKVGCVFQMIIVSILLHVVFGPYDHRKDASHFRNL